LRKLIYGAATERELKSQAVNMTLATPPSKTAVSLLSYRPGGNMIEEEDEEDSHQKVDGISLADALAAES
jgi:hypothetical protein